MRILLNMMMMSVTHDVDVIKRAAYNKRTYHLPHLFCCPGDGGHNSTDGWGSSKGGGVDNTKNGDGIGEVSSGSAPGQSESSPPSNLQFGNGSLKPAQGCTLDIAGRDLPEKELAAAVKERVRAQGQACALWESVNFFAEDPGFLQVHHRKAS